MLSMVTRLKWGFPLVMSLLILLGTARNIVQHQAFAGESRRAGNDLRALVEVVPGLQAPAYLLFVTPEGFDPNAIPNGELRNVGSGLHEALNLIYDNPSVPLLGTESCYSRRVSCTFQASGVLVDDEGVEVFIPYTQMIVIEVSDTLRLLTELPPSMPAVAEASSYAPLDLVDASGELPSRVSTLLLEQG
jgi:hypothetical protein